MNPDELIHRYLLGEATQAEVEELDGLLAKDADLRRKLVFEAGTDTGLREIALERMASTGPAASKTISPIFRPMAWASAAAALLLLAALTWTQLTRPKIIATIASVEDAAWESSLPTELGADLSQGYLKLTSGIATIRFRSGTEVTLEAPANLVLLSPMRTRLISGAAIVDVPESAIGFTLETPDGYAIDYGTRFAVNVSGETQRSDFEVLSGEISVHHPETASEVYLTEHQATSVTARGLDTRDGLLPEKKLARAKRPLRVGINGRSTSVIRNDERSEYLHPDFLMAKRSEKTTEFDRHAIFAFDISEFDIAAMRSARLRLNLVPSGVGFRAHLPRMNRFAIYGIIDESSEDWKVDSKWDAAPAPKDGVLLGTFEIPRSLKHGSFGIESAALLDFLRSDSNGSVSFILTRETTEQDGQGLVHAFASDTHPEASGPILELSPTQTDSNQTQTTHE